MEIGKNYLVNTDNWFFAPDGQQYRAVFGKVMSVRTAEEYHGVKVNARSMNWYLTIGNVEIAGCQIHYAIQTDECSSEPLRVELDHQLETAIAARHSRIYFAQ